MLAGVLALAAVAGGCARNGVAGATDASAADSRVDSAQRTVAEVSAALSGSSPGDAVEFGIGAGRATLATMAANITELGLREIELRLVGAPAPVFEGIGRAADTWLGTVELSYRLGAWDRQAARMEVAVAFAPDAGGRQLLAAVGGHDARTPLWVAGPVTALDSPRVLVMIRGDRSDHGSGYLRLTRRAARDVSKVLPGRPGRLVVEVPASAEELRAALDARPGEYDDIAAVTASVDGSLVPGAPVHVFVNPRVFDRLGAQGAQVVMTHESTHVATGAAFADIPAWLLEGFADYVALAHAGIPVETAAGQVLARVRESGPPDRLPTAEDLAPTAPGLGATYEEAWLAARFVAEEYGEERLVRFYDTVDDGRSTQWAFRRVLGTTERRFVARWAADVARLAGVRSSDRMAG